jgi:hypothetical protein
MLRISNFVIGAVMILRITCLPSHAAIIIDHSCTDFSSIPSTWIETVKSAVRLHYAHTSHGSQLVTGLERIEDQNSVYGVEIGYSYLPEEANTLCIFDGQEHETYISPELYWQTPEGRQFTQDVLDHNPTLTMSGWSWCCQLDYYSSGEVDEYLIQMASLEAANPGIRFIYMTGNAQGTGSDGYNRWQNNQKIRQYCLNNDKILFDFADLDAWWFNGSTWDSAFYEWEGYSVPVEHTQFHGDEAGHTTYESCEQKARALWWLLAVAAGWQSGEPTPTPPPTATPPDCDATGTLLWMPADEFRPGDACACTVTVCNAEGYDLENYPLFVILDAYGLYFFAPGFTEYENYLSLYPRFPPGNTVIDVLPMFTWPSGTGSASGLLFYSALTDPQMSSLFGTMDQFEFGWRP